MRKAIKKKKLTTKKRAPSRKAREEITAPPGAVLQELHNATGESLKGGEAVTVDAKRPFKGKWSHARFPKKGGEEVLFGLRAAQPIKKDAVGKFYVQIPGSQPPVTHVVEPNGVPVQGHYEDVGGHVATESFGSRPTKTYGAARLDQRNR